MLSYLDELMATPADSLPTVCQEWYVRTAVFDRPCPTWVPYGFPASTSPRSGVATTWAATYGRPLPSLAAGCTH